MDVGLPAGPNFFLLSGAEPSTEALRAAGFESPTFRQLPQVWRHLDPVRSTDRCRPAPCRD